MANAGPNTNGSQCGARGGMSLPARASPRRATWRQADRARCHRAGSSCAWPRRRGWTASMWRAAYPTLSHPIAGRSTCAVACVALCTAAPGGRAGARAPARRAGRAPTARPRRAGVWAGRVGLRRRARRGGLRQPRRGDIAGRGDRGRGRPAPGRRCGGPARCQPRRLGRHAWSQCACTSACACSGLRATLLHMLAGGKQRRVRSACRTASRHHHAARVSMLGRRTLAALSLLPQRLHSSC